MNQEQYLAKIPVEVVKHSDSFSCTTSDDGKSAFVLMKKRCMVDLSQITGPMLKISPEYFSSLCVQEVPVQTISAVETIKNEVDKSDSAARSVLLFEETVSEVNKNTVQSADQTGLFSNACKLDREPQSQNKEKRTAGKEKGKYTCQVCFKKFTQLGNLCIHQRIHTGDRPFECTFCSKSFTQLCNMWKHVRTHTGEKPYQCLVCGRAFSQQANREKHMRIHTGERPYPCNLCDKSFTQRANLLKHELVHTGERPFACRYCGKGFSQLSNLDKHQRVHTGVKPYSCATCGRSFTQQGNLAKHEAIHSEHKPFACPFCSKSYTQKYNMEKHVERCQSVYSQ